MAKPAYVLLNTTGTVERVHSPDIGGGQPSAGAADLETLITNGYLAKREIALDGGKILIVMEKP